MANNFRYYGGDNQIARLPFKTIDALQQLGLYAVKNETDYKIDITSDMAENDPDYTASLSAFGDISCSNIDTGDVRTYNLYLGANKESINDIFTKKIKISKNLAVLNSFTESEISEIRKIDETGRTCLLYDGVRNVVLVRDITIIRNQIVGMKGIIITDGNEVNSTNIKQWRVTNNVWKAPIPFDTTKQYVHMMKIVSTAGDTCYLTAVSPMSKRAETSYITVKMYIIGDSVTAEGTSVSTMTGEYACSGYNTTLNKTIVALDLSENKFVYSDGTKSAEALSSSNTTVTGDVYGQAE